MRVYYLCSSQRFPFCADTAVKRHLFKFGKYFPDPWWREKVTAPSSARLRSAAEAMRAFLIFTMIEIEHLTAIVHRKAVCQLADAFLQM
jgi:hypothetical protein